LASKQKCRLESVLGQRDGPQISRRHNPTNIIRPLLAELAQHRERGFVGPVAVQIEAHTASGSRAVVDPRLCCGGGGGPVEGGAES